MHWYVTDETNNDSSQGQFFIYGGLVVTDEQVAELNGAVAEIRTKYGYLPGDQFKFHTRSRPSQVSIGDARLAKQELVERLRAIGVRMIVYVVLHDIAAGRSANERVEYALNTVVWSYHRLLADEKAQGVMVIDRDDERHGHLSHLFQHGLSIDGKSIPIDDRVLFLGMTSDNASHLSSAVDITLGAFRYCVNTAGGAGNEVVASDIFPPLAELLWGVQRGDVKHIGGYGYVARPLEVRKPEFADKYRKLRDALARYADADADEGPSSSD
jgi:hypothetical protein